MENKNSLARSKWKLVYFSISIWRKILLLKRKRRFIFENTCFDRSSTIPKCFFRKLVKIHKGKNTRSLLIHNYIIGYKFGEFSFSRKPYHFPLKKSLKRKNVFFRK